MVTERYDVLQVVSKLQIRPTRIVSLDDVAVMVVIGYLDLQRGDQRRMRRPFGSPHRERLGFSSLAAHCMEMVWTMLGCRIEHKSLESTQV